MKSVARNYAIAFLNSFIDEISLEDFQAIRAFLRFLKEHKKIDIVKYYRNSLIH